MIPLTLTMTTGRGLPYQGPTKSPIVCLGSDKRHWVGVSRVSCIFLAPAGSMAYDLHKI